MATTKYLKRGSCGDLRTETHGSRTVVVRNLRTASFGCRRLARLLARREARALRRLADIPRIPDLVAMDGNGLERSYIPGLPMHEAKPVSRAYYRNALRLLRSLHAAKVAHNDLAKEANWICQGDEPAIVDFQLAICFERRSAWFRLLAREDLRHLLKHKATYCPNGLTARQKSLLAHPAWTTRCWRAVFKPPYWFVTRKILRWPERIGAAERERKLPAD